MEIYCTSFIHCKWCMLLYDLAWFQNINNSSLFQTFATVSFSLQHGGCWPFCSASLVCVCLWIHVLLLVFFPGNHNENWKKLRRKNDDNLLSRAVNLIVQHSLEGSDICYRVFPAKIDKRKRHIWPYGCCRNFYDIFVFSLFQFLVLCSVRYSSENFCGK